LDENGYWYDVSAHDQRILALTPRLNAPEPITIVRTGPQG
jgi:hypothetical protein